MIALYMRLSRADGDLEGDGAVSNSIANQRAILRSFVEGDADLARLPAQEFVDDGFSGSNLDRPEMKRMLSLCRRGVVDCVVVKDLSRFAREYIDAGTYIEQVFPFLRVRFVSIAEGYDSAACDLDAAAPGLAIRNIANAAYCRDTSVRVQSTLHTKWRRGLRPHAMPPFGYMVDPDDPMRLAPDERFAPGVRRLFELAAQLADPKAVALRLDEEGVDRPGVAFRKRGLYGYDKRPEPKSRRWSSTQVQEIVRDPVYKGTLVAGKTHRRVMSKRACDIVPDERRYVTDAAHPPLVSEALWEAAQACRRENDRLKGAKRSAPKSPFANGFVKRAECGHSLKPHQRKVADGFFSCCCDCSGADGRRVTDIEIADALAAALDDGASLKAPSSRRAAVPGPAAPATATAARRLEAYERYAAGRASIEDVRAISAPAQALAAPSAVDRLLANDEEAGRAELVSALKEHRFDDVDRKLLRRLVARVLVHEGGRLEVQLAQQWQ